MLDFQYLNIPNVPPGDYTCLWLLAILVGAFFFLPTSFGERCQSQLTNIFCRGFQPQTSTVGGHLKELVPLITQDGGNMLLNMLKGKPQSTTKRPRFSMFFRKHDWLGWIELQGWLNDHVFTII